MDNLPVLIAVIAGLVLLAGLVWFGRYQVGLRRVTDALVAAEEALDAGEIERARALTAPLLSRFPRLAVVQEVAADVLYAGGDPLSAASLWEAAMKRLGASRVAPRLVAAYTALNRPGDARRVAQLVPDDPLARVTLAWCELAAIGGDRARGRELAAQVARDRTIRDTASGDAMTSVLEAIVASHAGDLAAMRAALDRANARSSELSAQDRAFIGYLCGIALRNADQIEDARETWTMAVDVAPDTIGSALARRERSHLPPTETPST